MLRRQFIAWRRDAQSPYWRRRGQSLLAFWAARHDRHKATPKVEPFDKVSSTTGWSKAATMSWRSVSRRAIVPAWCSLRTS